MRFDIKGVSADQYVLFKMGNTLMLLKAKKVNIESNTINFGVLTIDVDYIDILAHSYSLADLIRQYERIELLIDGEYMSFQVADDRALELALMIENGARVMEVVDK